MRVSLFTREWIEIFLSIFWAVSLRVSLFTREWIEIVEIKALERSRKVSLFTREWIEIGHNGGKKGRRGRLPLYEGVD